MTLELRELRHLLALAEHGSLGRAATALGMTQPALTRSLKVLEHKVGGALFERSKAGIAPTDEGRVLIQRAREVVQVADQLDRDVVRRRTAGAGALVVGAGPFPAETLMPAALARLCAEKPQTQVRVVVREWDELLRRLRAREIDFFVAETSTLEGEHDLEVEALAPHPLYVVGRRGHPLARRGVRSADWFACPIVVPSRIPPRVLQPIHATGLERAARAGIPFPGIEFGNLSGVKRLIAASDAIAPLTLTCVEQELERGSLAVLGGEPWLHLRYGVVALKGRAWSAPARILRDRLREQDAALVRDEARIAGRLAPGRPGRRSA